VQYIAAVATGAIAHGMLVANTLGLPFIYVRPKPKEHGLENQIEGVIDPGKTVVVIEDLISTGGSSVNAIEALRKAEFRVLGLYAIFSYEFWKAIDALSEICAYTALIDYHELIKTAVAYNYITNTQAAILNEWHDNVNKNESI
jgi:orotate phosphoribosyltransferase